MEVCQIIGFIDIETWRIVGLVVILLTITFGTWFYVRLAIRVYKNKLWTHTKTGNEYMPTEICKMKNPANGEWVKAVIYRRDGNVYVRERILP